MIIRKTEETLLAIQSRLTLYGFIYKGGENEGPRKGLASAKNAVSGSAACHSGPPKRREIGGKGPPAGHREQLKPLKISLLGISGRQGWRSKGLALFVTNL